MGSDMTRVRLILPIASCLVLFALWSVWPESAIKKVAFDSLSVGMTLQEVEQKLGGPARDESTGPLCTPTGGYWPGVLHKWICDTCIIDVGFDDDGHLAYKDYYGVRRHRECAWTDVMRWFRI